MMLAEPPFNSRESREKMVEAMFETYAPPALFLGKNAVLSSFATGRPTSLVVDVGHEGAVGVHPNHPSPFSKSSRGSLRIDPPLPVFVLYPLPIGVCPIPSSSWN
jgi:hypothetical protein